jgi:dipeptidyl aminopeptidase/acylaminoacyl peptidase
MPSARTFALWILASLVFQSPAAAQAPPGPPAFSVFEGIYRLPDGGTLLVARMGVIDAVARPYFLDWETGRYGYLFAAGTDRFTSPASAVDKPDAPVRTEIAFRRSNGRDVDGLTIQEAGLPPRQAFRIQPWADRDAVIESGDVRLAATLRMPRATARVPGIVLIHGSGPGTRTQLSLMNTFFASRGLAVLTYDKRGCGGSGGDWKTVDLEVLADDALAGVRWLKAQPGIDPARVGVWGISQGGWIGPLAASLDPSVAFVINTSGPATSLRRQDSYMMANTLKARGYTADEIALVLKGLDLLYDFGRGKASAAALDAVMDEARAHPKLKEIALPPAKEISPAALYANQQIGDPAWFFHLDPDRDALRPYRVLKCPVLVTYGRLDYTVPVEESAQLLKEIAAMPAHRNLAVVTSADSGHGYLRMQESNPMAPVSPTTVSRELFRYIDDWLVGQGLARDR